MYFLETRSGHTKIFEKTILVRLKLYAETVIFAQAFSLLIFSCIHHRLLFLLQLSANRRRISSSSELDIMN